MDAVVADFIAGATERLVVEGHERGGELLLVEGQGSIVHPAYSGVTLGLIHGSAPHAFVLCHLAGATEIEGYPGHPLPPLAELVALHEAISLPRRKAKVACIALNTRHVGDDEARAAIAAAEEATGLAADDPVRFGAEKLLRRNARRAPGRRVRSDPAGGRRERVDEQEAGETRCACGRVCRLLALLALLADATALAGVGANDDSAKFDKDGGAAFYAQMAALGLRESLLTVRFRPSEPSRIPDQDVLDSAVEQATAARLQVVFAVYPYPPRELAAGGATPASFAAWLTNLAERYPQVRQYVVGNEPNQAAFLRPQFGTSGRSVSAATAGRYLAAGYDALKAVDPGITVVGIGLSPRGNDDPRAPTNPSVSPMRFVSALGRWYRASGRTAPLMDGFSFHPYPRRATDPLAQGYIWPNAGFVNLDRVKQGLWDAFHGTAQPTTVDGLKLYLDEVGWQVDTSGRPGYAGKENVPVTTEATQAGIYSALVRQAACDPAVAEVNFFGFHDDGLRTGFQAGLYRADGSPRPPPTRFRRRSPKRRPAAPASRSSGRPRRE